MLCDLAPTCKNPKGTHIPMIRRCYIHLLTQMQHDNNIANTEMWTKLLLLARVLLTPTDETAGKWTREQRCRWVMADDWSHFTLGAFGMSSEDVYESLRSLHPARENDYELPRPPRNLPEPELDADTVIIIIIIIIIIALSSE